MIDNSSDHSSDNDPTVDITVSSNQSYRLDLTQLLTGLAVSATEALEKGNVASLSLENLSRLFQASIKGQFCAETEKMLREYQNKGNLIKDTGSLTTARLVLEFVNLVKDPTITDYEVLRCARAIFINGISTSASEQEQSLAITLLKVCRNLSGEDILILRNCDNLLLGYRAGVLKELNSSTGWAKHIADISFFGITELVLTRVKMLVDLGILGKPIYTDESSFEHADKARLTKLGMALCRFLKNPPSTDSP